MLNKLKNVPLFSELSDQELATIAKIATTHNVTKNSVVVHEGDAGNSLFVILQGSAKISYYAPDGREVVLTLLSEGDFFGEISLLDGEPRSATVSTLESSQLAQIRRGDLEREIIARPQLAIKLLHELASRLRRTSQVLERVSTLDVPHRLYTYLRDYCARYGKPDADELYEVKLPTHQLMADQLSTSRETISRAVSTLKKDGIIVPVQGRSLVKVDMEAVEALLINIY